MATVAAAMVANRADTEVEAASVAVKVDRPVTLAEVMATCREIALRDKNATIVARSVI